MASRGKGAVCERFWLCGQLRSAGASTLCIPPLRALVYKHVVSVIRTRETRVPPPGLNPGASGRDQWVKRKARAMLPRVRVPGATSDCSPRVNSQCRFCSGAPAASVYYHLHQHLRARSKSQTWKPHHCLDTLKYCTRW